MPANIPRRRFIALSSLGAASTIMRPFESLAEIIREPDDVYFTLTADVHVRRQQDQYGCPAEDVSLPQVRWKRVFEKASDWNADVVFDLGDLQPRSFETGPGKQVLDVWNAWDKEKLAIFGNHDDDFMPKQEYLDAMGMPAGHYRKQVKNWTFIALDSGSNATPLGLPDSDWGLDQLGQLEKWIEEAPGYCALFVHHGVLATWQNLPTETVQQLLRTANEKAGYTKVVACFYGHRHIPHIAQQDGVYHVSVNSLNYRWLRNRGHGHFFYRDPAPFIYGAFTGDGKVWFHGTGKPDNWADCPRMPDGNLPTSATYQIGLPRS